MIDLQEPQEARLLISIEFWMLNRVVRVNRKLAHNSFNLDRFFHKPVNCCQFEKL